MNLLGKRVQAFGGGGAVTIVSKNLLLKQRNIAAGEAARERVKRLDPFLIVRRPFGTE